MLLRFEERIELPAAAVYSYFRTPEDWVRLYGSFGEVEDLGDGWRSVALRGFPWPLIARITHDEPERRVSWEFRGFWRGDGEVRFDPVADGVVVTGHERIRPAGLSLLAPVAERWFLNRRFRAIWALGFRRLRREAMRTKAGD